MSRDMIRPNSVAMGPHVAGYDSANKCRLMDPHVAGYDSANKCRLIDPHIAGYDSANECRPICPLHRGIRFYQTNVGQYVHSTAGYDSANECRQQLTRDNAYVTKK